MTHQEVLEQLPLYAGGDLEPARAAAVEAAVALDPALAAQLGELDALDDLLREHLGGGAEEAGPGLSATRAEPEARPVTVTDGPAHGALANSLDGRTSSAAEDAPKSGLTSRPSDTRSGDAPAAPLEPPPRLSEQDASVAPAEPVGDGASAPLVRRQCPFCHDHLGAEPVTFCGTCATPHHEACFGENTGCALLGCGGTTSIRVGGDASRVCELCRRHTPAGAPFCAWCGEHARRPSRPRHETLSRRPRRHVARATAPSRRPFLVAAATLLAVGLGLGAGLGWLQSALLAPYTLGGSALPSGRDSAQLSSMLAELVTLQRAYRARHGRYADDLEALLRDPVAAHVDLELLMDLDKRYGFEFELTAGAGELIAIAKPRWPTEGDPRWTATWSPHVGAVQVRPPHPPTLTRDRQREGSK